MNIYYPHNLCSKSDFFIIMCMTICLPWLFFSSSPHPLLHHCCHVHVLHKFLSVWFDCLLVNYSFNVFELEVMEVPASVGLICPFARCCGCCHSWMGPAEILKQVRKCFRLFLCFLFCVCENAFSIQKYIFTNNSPWKSGGWQCLSSLDAWLQ